MALKIIFGDIVKERTDALVTLASKEPKVGSGVDKSVHKAAGPRLLEERLKTSVEMSPGKAVCTKSFDLKKTCGAKNVIHVSSVIWENGTHDEEIILDAIYLKAIVIANSLGAITVSLPMIGAGKYGVPKKLALDQAVKSLTECSMYFPHLKIKLVIVDAEIYDYAKSKYSKICERRFTEGEWKQFNKDHPQPKPLVNIEGVVVNEKNEPLIDPERTSKYWKQLNLRQFENLGSLCKMFDFCWKSIQMQEEKRFRNLKELEEASGVSMSTIKHIRNGESKSPSRDTVLALGLALGFPASYANLMLKVCDHERMTKNEEEAFNYCYKKGEMKFKEFKRLLDQK